jgi:translation initiation factor 1 (eIF-1/SUI1)
MYKEDEEWEEEDKEMKRKKHRISIKFDRRRSRKGCC